MNLNQEIESRIQRFVAELNDLIRRQALQAVAEALGTNGSSARSADKSARNATLANVGISTARVRPKGEKRSAAELAELERSLFDYVRANPGLRVEEIGRALQLRTSELARPLKKLIAGLRVRTEGAKRATRYFANVGEPSTKTGTPKKKAAKKR